MCFCERNYNVHSSRVVCSVGHPEYCWKLGRHWFWKQGVDNHCHHHCCNCCHDHECISVVLVLLLREKWNGTSFEVCRWAEEKERVSSLEKKWSVLKCSPSRCSWTTSSSPNGSTKWCSCRQWLWRIVITDGNTSIDQWQKQALIWSWSWRKFQW